VMNSWGNKGGQLSADEIKSIRANTPRPKGAAH
jgi:hypothetical protein